MHFKFKVFLKKTSTSLYVYRYNILTDVLNIHVRRQSTALLDAELETDDDKDVVNLYIGYAYAITMIMIRVTRTLTNTIQ